MLVRNQLKRSTTALQGSASLGDEASSPLELHLPRTPDVPQSKVAAPTAQEPAQGQEVRTSVANLKYLRLDDSGVWTIQSGDTEAFLH